MHISTKRLLYIKQFRKSLLGDGLLGGLGSLAGGSGGLASGGSLTEDLATLLLVVPVEVLLELSHGHLVGGLGRLLAAWGGHGGSLLLATGGGLLSSSLLRSLLLASALAGSVLEDLLDGLLDIGTLSGFLGGGLLALGSALGGSLLGTLDGLDLGGSGGIGSLGGGTLLLDVDVVDGEDGGVALLEGEVGEVVTLGSRGLHDATLNLSLGGSGDLGNVGEGVTLDVLGKSGLDGVVAELLDLGLELVVAEEVDGVSGGVQSLVQVGLEGVDDEADFEVAVGGEEVSGVNTSHLEAPVVEDNNLVVEVNNVDVAELGLELSDGILGEVGLNEEETIGHEEEGVALLDVGLQGLLEVLGDLGEVTTLVEHLGEELLEGRLLSGRLGHFVYEVFCFQKNYIKPRFNSFYIKLAEILNLIGSFLLISDFKF
jgi:hypothetical protein